MIDDLINLDDLAPADRDDVVAGLDRLTARFGYAVAFIAAALALFHLVRWFAS